MKTAFANGVAPDYRSESELSIISDFTLNLMHDIQEGDSDVFPQEYDYFLIHAQSIFLELCGETGFNQTRKEKYYSFGFDDASPRRDYVRSLGRQAFEKIGIKTSFQRLCECSNFLGLIRRLSEQQRPPENFSDQKIFNRMENFFEGLRELADDYKNYPLTTTYP